MQGPEEFEKPVGRLRLEPYNSRGLDDERTLGKNDFETIAHNG